MWRSRCPRNRQPPRTWSSTSLRQSRPVSPQERSRRGRGTGERQLRSFAPLGRRGRLPLRDFPILLGGLDGRGQAGKNGVERHIDEVFRKRSVVNQQTQVERAIKDVEDRVRIEIGTDLAIFHGLPQQLAGFHPALIHSESMRGTLFKPLLGLLILLCGCGTPYDKLHENGSTIQSSRDGLYYWYYHAWNGHYYIKVAWSASPTGPWMQNPDSTITMSCFMQADTMLTKCECTHMTQLELLFPVMAFTSSALCLIRLLAIPRHLLAMYPHSGKMGKSTCFILIG